MNINCRNSLFIKVYFLASFYIIYRQKLLSIFINLMNYFCFITNLCIKNKYFSDNYTNRFQNIHSLIQAKQINKFHKNVHSLIRGD